MSIGSHFSWDRVCTVIIFGCAFYMDWRLASCKIPVDTDPWMWSLMVSTCPLWDADFDLREDYKSGKCHSKYWATLQGSKTCLQEKGREFRRSWNVLLAADFKMEASSGALKAFCCQKDEKTANWPRDARHAICLRPTITGTRHYLHLVNTDFKLQLWNSEYAIV